MDNVDEDWIKNVEDIKIITVSCQPAFRISRLFDGSWDRDNVHFIVMAEMFPLSAYKTAFTTVAGDRQR